MLVEWSCFRYIYIYRHFAVGKINTSSKRLLHFHLFIFHFEASYGIVHQNGGNYYKEYHKCRKVKKIFVSAQPEV